jgi:hypothetical protein
MSEASRQRRLSVENRLLEYRTRYGREIEDMPMPAFLESYEGALAERSRRADNGSVCETSAPDPHPQTVVSPPVAPTPATRGVDLSDLDV